MKNTIGLNMHVMVVEFYEINTNQMKFLINQNANIINKIIIIYKVIFKNMELLFLKIK